MIYFNNDYCEGCHPKILEKLLETNYVQTPGYGTDDYCRQAADLIRRHCGSENLDVHFLVGGTQANLTVIDAALRPHQGALCAVSGHINVHETGAVEATGHKVLALPSDDGKITARQVREYVLAHRNDPDAEHTVQPKLVYISNPTELGTLYSLAELTALSEACHELGLYLFLDGARLGYGLAARGNDVTLVDIARLCDVFYIGGTKVGALFGEAVVFSNKALGEDFRYFIKQHGGMLAKGRLLGIQFGVLFEDDLYYQLGAYADGLADQLRDTLTELGCPMLVEGISNQLFPILPDTVLAELAKEFSFVTMDKIGDDCHAVRFCTSWATKQENVDKLCVELKQLLKK
jgi:threonine aldolase